jgi:hypothetical protein
MKPLEKGHCGLPIVSQHEHFFGHLVDRLDQLRIIFVASPSINSGRHLFNHSMSSSGREKEGCA